MTPSDVNDMFADPRSNARIRIRLVSGGVALVSALVSVASGARSFFGWPESALVLVDFWPSIAGIAIALISVSIYVHVTLLQNQWSSSFESTAVRKHSSSAQRLPTVLASAKAMASTIGAASKPPSPAVGQERALALYLRMFADPPSVITRISEQVEPRTASQLVRTSYTITLPEDLNGRIVVPLFRAPRGRIQDGLRFFGPNEERLSSLTHSQGVAFALGVIRRLVEAADKQALTDYELWIEQDIATLMMNSTQYSEATSPTLQEQTQILSTKFKNLHNMRGYRLQVILAIIAVHLSSDVVCVSFEAPKSEGALGPRSVRLAVERTDPKLTVSLSKRGNSWSQKWILARLPYLRRGFGVETTIYRHSLAYAELSSSYHLSIAGPPGTYLSKQVIQPRDKTAGRILSPSAALLGPRRGQRHSHAYIRNDNSPFRDLEVATTFYERPPGAIISALLSATAASIVSLLIATRGLLPAPVEAADADLTAILLAFPAGIAIWAGFNDSSRQSLSAYFSKFITIVGCITGAFVSILGDQLGDRLAPTWFIVCGVLAVNAVACGVSLHVRLQTSATVLRTSAANEQE